MAALEETIENRVGDRRVTESLVPLGDRQLGGDDRRSHRAVVDHLEQVGRLVARERTQQCVIEDEHVKSRERGHETRETPVAAREREIVKQSWRAHVERAVSAPDGVVGERAGEERLAHPGRPGHEHVAMGAHPVALGEAEHRRAVEAARTAQVTQEQHENSAFARWGRRVSARPWPWAVLLVVLVALWFRKRQPVLGFLVLWWPLALMPCLDYRQLSWPLVSDRFSFIPSVGLCLAIAYLAVVWLPRRTSATAVCRFALPALGLVALIWGAQTVRAIPHWRDNQTLMKYAARQAPDSPFVHIDKAWELQYREHDLDGAAREFETALRLNNASFRPVFNLTYNAYLGLGHIALEKGRREEAKQYFEKAIRFWPQMSSAYHSLGALYFTEGDYAHAAEIFQQAVGRDPQDLIGRFYLGTCRMKLGEYRKAAEQFHTARVVDPTYREAYEAEARALEAAGDAAGAAEPAARPNPRDRALWRAAGDAHRHTGQWGAALADFDHATTLGPVKLPPGPSWSAMLEK